MQDDAPTLEAALKRFPDHLRAELEQIAGNGGMLCANMVHHLCNEMDSDIEQLMLQLVPLAASYGTAPVSGYFVGAVARGQRQDANGYPQLYLGANLEFPHQALCYSLHAEQAAVANAWHHREPGIASVAVSAPPCGHCRQFLYELCGSTPLGIIFPDSTRQNYREMDIAELLPGAFGPMDLGHTGNMMAANSHPVSLQIESAEALTLNALEAARFSYAPYTNDHAGCALQLQDGSIFSGSYAENAAHNPALSPLHAALSNMRMALGPDIFSNLAQTLARCVLVESDGNISQRELATTLLSSIAPEIALEYYPARAANE